MDRDYKLSFTDNRKQQACHMPIAVLLAVALLSGMLALDPATGCAGHKSNTVKTVTVEEPDAAAAGPDEAQQPRPLKKTETTTTTESDDSSPGIIGSAFRLVWAVISLPFRVIGTLF
jgi:hypothetical protein